MGHGPGQSSDLFSGLPFGEAELLAYVEDDLSGPRQSELAEFLESRPDVRRALDAMREDHLLLRQIGDARAPEGIVDEALAVLEREALLGTEDRIVEPAPVAIPIERARPARAFRALAMAAGFLLLVGGASYWISVLVKPAQSTPVLKGSGPLALETKPRTDESPVVLADAQPEAPSASESAETDEPEPARDLAMTDTADSSAGSGSPVQLSGIHSQPYPLATISPERALELAREGRLAIYLTPRASGPRSNALSANTGASPDHDLPYGALVIDVPATAGDLSDLCVSLSDTADGDTTFGELPEPFDGAAATADEQIAGYWRVRVPVLVDY